MNDANRPQHSSGHPEHQDPRYAGHPSNPQHSSSPGGADAGNAPGQAAAAGAAQAGVQPGSGSAQGGTGPENTPENTPETTPAPAADAAQTAPAGSSGSASGSAGAAASSAATGSAATGGSGSGSSGSGGSGGGSSRGGPRQQPQPRSRANLWLFNLLLAGAVGGMGWYAYNEFYLDEFADLQERVAALDTETLAEELAAQQEEVLSEWQERAAAVEEKLERSEAQAEQVSELAEKIAALEASLADVDALDEIRALRDEFDTEMLGRIEEALAEIEKLEDLEGIDSRVATLETQLADLEEQLANLEMPEGGVDEGMFEERFAELEARIEALGELDDMGDDAAARFAELEERLAAFGDLEGQVAELQALDERVTELAERVDDSTALEERLDEKLEARMGEFEETLRGRVAELEEQLQGRIAELTEQIGRLDTLSPEDAEGWIRAEARHLTQIAQQRLRYHQDKKGALDALTRADALFTELGGAAVEQREALAAALDELIAYSPPDLGPLRERLLQQIERVDGLAVRGKLERQLGEEMPQIDDEGQRGYERAWLRMREGLGSLIQVHREDDFEPFIPAEQRYFIRENLRMQLESALYALGRADEGMFRHSIERAEAWLERYFDGGDSDVAETLQELRDMVDEPIKRDPPDIEPLLEPVKSF
ncbi:hypothetical protein CKO15_01675 [Halorhodospira abdelmalekii]|uniref:uroporphyrinogen-III C-methyltransferase n=1 Tax=Halorhodospira abdelmalekii TaxID=421629 RepID=UPI001907171C|nr:uroporphyrinogen-III C-methyltransferase [Halorhodospira abdelmalekii]MBK1734010.1 hypothetical protein [Halorhodospira abdelmalekii]